MTEMQAGQSYVEVLPSMRGFHARVKKGVSGQSVDVTVTPKVSQADLLKAKKQVEEAADGVAKARQKEADAAGTVRAAEAKLNDLRETGKAKAAQLVAAEERLAKAKRASEAASAALSRAEGAERSATRRVERIQVEIDTDTGEATGELEGWHARMKAAIGELRTYVDVDTGAATAKLLLLSKIQVGTFGLVGALHAVLNLTAALAPAAGALALLPALAGAAGVGVLFVKTAFTGFADAVGDNPKKAAEALAKMAPAARDTAQAVNGLKPAWQGLQLEVQDRMFAGIGDRIRTTGGTYIPILRGALGGLAGDLNGPIRDAFDVLDEAGNVEGLTIGLGFVRQGLASAGGALAPLTQAFTTLFVEGSPYVARFGLGIREAAGAFSLFIGNASRAGLITQWIDNALVVLSQLGQLVANVFSILISLTQASASTGGNLLSVLVAGSAALASWLNSAEGIAVMEGLFRGMAAALGFAAPLFSAIGSALSGTIIPAISAGLPIVGQALGALAPAVAPLAALFAALVPLVTQVTVALAQGLAGALVAILPFVTGLVNILAQYPGVVAAVVAGFVIFGGLLGPIVRIATAIGGLMPILNVLRVAVAGAGGPVAVLGQAFRFLTGPIGIAIGLFVLMMSRSAAFRDAVFGLVGAVGGLVGTLVGALMPVVTAVLGALLPLVDVLAVMLVPIINVLAGVINFLAPVLGFLVPLILGIVAAIRVWAIVQALINFLLTANPIGIIIVAIGALVAAVIYAWQNFAWFRDIVTGAWNLIVAAAMWAWQAVLMPVLTALSAAVTAVGNFFVWLWQSVIVPAWNAIAAVITWAWTSIIWPVLQFIGTALAYLGLAVTVLFVTPFYLAWQALVAVVGWAWGILQAIWYGALLPALQFLGSIFVWLWQTIIVPAWNGIVAAVMFAWGVLQGIWYGMIVPALQFLGSIFMWLWTAIIVPAWNGIVAAVMFAWGVLQGIWYGMIVPALQFLASMFNWLWQTIIVPAWNGIVAAIQFAWGIIQNVFGFVMRGVDAVGRAFQFVADWIGRAWDSIREAARRPVQWVVDVVYNNGIRPVWNGIAGLFGMAQLGPVTLAEGGVLGGYAPGRDTVPALLSRGEGVLVPEAVRGLGAGFVGWANRTFSGGRSDGGVGTPQGGRFSRGGVARFAEGGILDGIGAAISGTGDFFMNVFTDPAGAVKKLFSGVLGDGANTPGAGGWTDALKALPGKAVDGVIARVKKWIEEMASMMGGAGGNWMPVIMQALAITGNSPDNAWRVAKQIQIESGGNPRAINLWDINAKRGTPSKGLIQTIDPTFRAYRHPGLPNDPYHPLANIVAGIRYATARYGSIAAIWPKTMGYAAGGVVPGSGPADSVIARVTPGERVLTPRQTADFGRLVRVLDSGRLGATPLDTFTRTQWSSLRDLVDQLSELPETLRSFAADLQDAIAQAVNRSGASATATGSSAGSASGTVTGAVSASVGSTGMRAAARELLARLTAGGHVFEDLSFRGMSANLGAHNDDLIDVLKRYGDDGTREGTAAALKRFLAANGGYDRGGLAHGAGLMLKQTITPERVLSPRQTADFGRLVRALDSGRVQLPPGVTNMTDPSTPPAAAVSRSRIDGLAPVDNGGPRVVVNVHPAPEHDPERIAERVMARIDFATRTM